VEVSDGWGDWGLPEIWLGILPVMLGWKLEWVFAVVCEGFVGSVLVIDVTRVVLGVSVVEGFTQLLGPLLLTITGRDWVEFPLLSVRLQTNVVPLGTSTIHPKPRPVRLSNTLS